MAFYSSLDLYQLNSKTRSKLPVGIYNHCAALGIARRPHYIHRGSRRKQCTKTTISAVGCTIPVVCSSFRRLLTKTRYEDGNVNFTNLRHLEYVSSGALSGITTSSTITQPPVKMALVNARSLSNKTFILNDFFTSHAMDFLFVTETWLKNGDISSRELSPLDCSLYSTPKPSGHGGGLATVFRNSFKCRLLPVDASFSFEAQLLKMDLNGPLLCVLVYRPPKVSTTFIHELSEFLSNQVSRCDRLLVLGDFNIHVCCPSKPMVKNFMSLMDSLNFVQSVSSPTHNRSHTLDLVLTRGFSVHICEIFDAGILSRPVHYSLAFHANTALEFCESYSKFLSNSNVPPSSCMDTEQLVEIFNSACCTALNTVAPLKRKKCKISSSPQPWFNASTHTLRQECRRAECRWKKNGLQVSVMNLVATHYNCTSPMDYISHHALHSHIPIHHYTNHTAVTIHSLALIVSPHLHLIHTHTFKQHSHMHSPRSLVLAPADISKRFPCILLPCV